MGKSYYAALLGLGLIRECVELLLLAIKLKKIKQE
jgi:hypothetical protein